MKKVSILWFSESKNTYRRISLDAFKIYSVIALHLLLYTGIIVLSGICIYQHFSLKKTEKELLSLKNTIKNLTLTLTSKQEDINSLRETILNKSRKIAKLEKELISTQKELKDMKEMEIKIKKFLGLKSEDADSEKFSHQGGFEYKSSLNKNSKNTFSSPSFTDSNSTEIKDIVHYSKGLKENFEQLVDYLSQRHEELKHIPSILPVKGNHLWISCDFGWRINPFTQQKEFHGAIDIAGDWKTPIVAPADGVVVKVSKNKLLGNYVKIRHTKHIETLYGHLYKALVKKGDKVKRWDVIGYMGNSGHSTGTHVHYKIIVDGKPVNPIYYIYDRRIKNLALR